MPQINVIIVDDEKAAIEVITELTTQFAKDLCIVGVAVNGLQAMQLIIEKKPDLVFLDVDIPLMNGLQVIEKLSDKNFEIIFTTGSAGYALTAIKLQAADYLLKPIDPGDFMIAVEKVRRRILLVNNNGLSRKIELHTENGIIYVDETDILFVTGLGSYCNIMTVTDNEKILVSKSIGYIQDLLSDRFFRCHNSNLVNVDHIVKFISKDGNFIIMKNGASVEVSRRSKAALLEKLAHHSKR